MEIKTFKPGQTVYIMGTDRRSRRSRRKESGSCQSGQKVRHHQRKMG